MFAMQVCSAFELSLSALLCAALGGEKRFLIGASLCVCFALLSPLFPKRVPLPARVLLVPGMLFSLLPLWPMLFSELGEGRAPVLFALAVTGTVLLSCGKTPVLQIGAIPLALFSLLLCLCCLFGEYDRAVAEPLFSGIGCMVCPLAVGVALPASSVGNVRLPAVLSGALAAIVCAFPVLLFRNSICVCGALLSCCPICVSAELRVLRGADA